MNKGKIKITAMILSSALLLASCISVDAEITLRQDLSGEAIIKYSVAKSAVNTGRLDSEGRFLPFPIEEEKYRENADNTDGLSLKSYRQEETAEEILITVGYDFTNPEALNSIISGATGNSITIEGSGPTAKYTQLIIDNNGNIPGEDVLRLAEALFSSRYIRLSLTAPGEVKSVNSGTSQGRTAEVTYQLPQLLASVDPVVWEVSW